MATSEYYQGKPYPTAAVCRETGDIIDEALCTECESFHDLSCRGSASYSEGGEPAGAEHVLDPFPGLTADTPVVVLRLLPDGRAKITQVIDEAINKLSVIRNGVTRYGCPF